MKNETQTCSVCGQGGYWVGYDSTTGEDRCVNHIGTDREDGSPDV